MLPRALGCASNFTGGLARQQVISRSEVHRLASQGAKAKRRPRPGGCLHQLPVSPSPSPHPVSTGLTRSNKPDFVIPPTVTCSCELTCSCERDMLGPGARCRDRVIPSSFHRRLATCQGRTNGLLHLQRGNQGRVFFPPALGDSPTYPPQTCLCHPLCRGPARQPRESLSHLQDRY